MRHRRRRIARQRRKGLTVRGTVAHKRGTAYVLDPLAEERVPRLVCTPLRRVPLEE